MWKTDSTLSGLNDLFGRSPRVAPRRPARTNPGLNDSNPVVVHGGRPQGLRLDPAGEQAPAFVPLAPAIWRPETAKMAQNAEKPLLPAGAVSPVRLQYVSRPNSRIPFSVSCQWGPRWTTSLRQGWARYSASFTESNWIFPAPLISAAARGRNAKGTPL